MQEVSGKEESEDLPLIMIDLVVADHNK